MPPATRPTRELSKIKGCAVGMTHVAGVNISRIGVSGRYTRTAISAQVSSVQVSTVYHYLPPPPPVELPYASIGYCLLMSRCASARTYLLGCLPAQTLRRPDVESTNATAVRQRRAHRHLAQPSVRQLSKVRAVSEAPAFFLRFRPPASLGAPCHSRLNGFHASLAQLPMLCRSNTHCLPIEGAVAGPPCLR